MPPCRKLATIGIWLSRASDFWRSFGHRFWSPRHFGTTTQPERAESKLKGQVAIINKTLTMTTLILGATLLCSIFRIASGTSQVEFRPQNDETRIRELNGDDFQCPYNEETLLYNIDINIEGVGEGCDNVELLRIGDLLQEIVSEVEAEIPEYKRTENMQTIL